MHLNTGSGELDIKLGLVREAMAAHGIGAVRLRGADWFAWATGGGSNLVLQTAETGVAEVLVTADAAFVLTDWIEQERMRDEEVPAALEVWATPWQEPARREAFVRERVSGRPIASDRPQADEQALPEALVRAKRRLLPAEVERYRVLGREAAEAMTEVLSSAEPAWTEYDLAAAGAAALWRRGIHPALVLAAGEARGLRYRHPTPSRVPLGGRAMLVFCARRHGLFANLTRFLSFGPLAGEVQRREEAVRAVEAAAFRYLFPGVELGEVYEALVAAYARLGFPGEHLRHHQGGTTGYLSREVVAGPGGDAVVEPNTALAWNPSLPGTKIEDTVLLTSSGLEVLTVDSAWPTVPNEDGLARPAVLIRP